MNNPVLVLGGGGHSLSVMDALMSSGEEIAGVLDSAYIVGQRVFGDICILGEDSMLGLSFDPNDYRIAVGVGPKPKSSVTADLFKKISKMNFEFAPVRHSSATVSEHAVLSLSSQILAGVIIQPGASLGAGSVLNTGASLDHGVSIGDHVHVGPGAVLCGDVSVKEGAYIGAGAVLFPGITIGEHAIVGAGTTVKTNVKAEAVVYGFHND